MKIRYGITLLFFLIISFLPLMSIGSAVKFILLGLIALYGITTLFDNSIKSFISYFTTPNEQRSNLLIYNRLNQLAKIIIPVISGWLWAKYNYYSVFGLGAIFSAICLLVSFNIYAAYKTYDDEVKPAEEEE
ncbi:MAG: MFS transporter, partial [Candidatus Delongbacteria bacterium]|nr:MFS transporter [Candidatus Delongbacteria bacterium]